VSQQLTAEPAGESGEILADRHGYPKLARANASDQLALSIQTRRPAGNRRPERGRGRGMAGGRRRDSISVSWPMSCTANCSSIFNARTPSTSA